MKKTIYLHIFLAFCLTAICLNTKVYASPLKVCQVGGHDPDSILPFPLPKDDGLNLLKPKASIYLEPSNIKTTIEYDPLTNQYKVRRHLGNMDYYMPYYLGVEDMLKYDVDRNMQKYWKERALVDAQDEQTGLIPAINIRSEAFDRLFGSNTIDVRPQGSAELRFGVMYNYREDKNLDLRMRRMTSFDFRLKLQMNVMANIGDKIKFNVNYNTEALNFELDNNLKLAYEGTEDEILRLIEAGNVSLPLNSKLITGSQALFGIKTKLQFGKLTLTGIIAKQNSNTSTVAVSGGIQNTPFELQASDYDENRHFFLSQYFRDNYEQSLSTLPVVTSNINITKIEVWVTNIGSAINDNRNIIAFSDLGEYDPYNEFIYSSGGYDKYPHNNINSLMSNIDTTQIRDINKAFSYLVQLPIDLVQGRDFEKVESARRLNTNEYSVNRTLGFISLNTSLSAGQVLAVAFQYTVDNEVYQVGEFSDEGISTPNSLIVKLLRSTTLETKHPMWDLMMKNVYALNAYQINPQDFVLNVLYDGNENGVPTGYFKDGPEGIKGVSLIKLFKMDSLDMQGNPIEGGDGIFDFHDGAATHGGTIQSSNGRVFFPVLEPFGSYLREILPEEMADKYAYDSLYTMTKTNAKQIAQKDKFIISGYYSSSGGSEIDLHAFDIPQGSVKVTAGGRTLIENVDYTVDYVFGRVKILNEGILNSGTTITATTENTALSGISTETQSLMGIRADYLVNPHLNLGATFLHLRKTPITHKVAYGYEPFANSMLGFDLQFQKEVPFITKLVDMLPLISTNAPSMVTADAEFAQFIPGHPNVIGNSGNSYIDDFESSKQTISLHNIGYWYLASTPSTRPESKANDLSYGFQRSKLAWYVIDPTFFGRGTTPPNITKTELSNHYVRLISQTELFPQADVQNNVPANLAVLNMVYYPDERGPYNYNVDELKADGTLENPEDKWAGIMRRMETTDFEANNVEYIEFWLMDPFVDPDDDGPQEPWNTTGGQLIFNLGDVSEDILKDGRKFYENGLPTDENVVNVDTTIWGRVPNLQALIYAFDIDPAARPYQDVGYDGLSSTREGVNEEYSFFYDSYIAKVLEKHGSTSDAYLNAVEDPSADDYHYFRGTDYDNDDVYSSILMRYKNINGPEGNSCAQELTPEPYDISSTSIPNTEDINFDNTLNESEKYYEYIVNLDPNNMEVGQNYITDIFTSNVQLANGLSSSVKWYQFKIPVKNPDNVVGNISDFTSIRFMRTYLTGFSEPVVLRFATFDLVKGNWRRYEASLLQPGEYVPNSSVNLTNFDVSTVSVEENSGNTDRVPYTIPPGIERERNYATTNQQRMNEQSLSLKVDNLFDGDARGAYKNCDFDFRNYSNLQMFVHAHANTASGNSKYANNQAGAITVFLRFGSDLTDNYYEYEVPVILTPWGVAVTSKDQIWMESNAMNIDIQRVIEVKQNRNEKIADGVENVSTIYPYTELDGKNRITVIGTPSVNNIKTMMIGVRNPKKNIGTLNDDGAPMSVTVWVNELRLTHFNEKSGWAATASLSANLADFGNVSVSGLYSTPGFGSIEKSVSQRSQETIANIYTSVNLEMGKILPEKVGLKVPVHFDYSQEVSTPEYDPLDPDIVLKDQLSRLEGEEKEDYKRKTQAYTKKTNVNLINVRKERTAGSTKKPHFWDIENFDISYSYSKTFQSDIDIEYYNKIVHTAGLGYTYNANPKNIKPFRNVKFLRHKAFALIRDFNFFYQPKTFSFRTSMDKNYIERLVRNKTGDEIIIRPTASRQWNWMRNYVLKYDLATSLKFDYAANVVSLIDEPVGIVQDKQLYKDVVWNSIKQFGTIRNFNQTAGVNWTIPINKLPFLDWTSANARYDVTYRWQASPISVQERMGNTIENSTNITLSGSMRLTRLYDKIPYIKDLNKSSKSLRPRNTKSKAKTNKKANDSTSVSKPKVNTGKAVADGFLKLLFGFKDINLSYQTTLGTVLPGFYPEPNTLGYNWHDKAPTWGFILGSQKDIRPAAVQGGWLTTDTLVNNQYIQNKNININYRVTYEPISDFRLEFTGTYRNNNSNREIFKADANGNFRSYSPTVNGSYQISYIALLSAFDRSKVVQDESAIYDDANVSALFEEMKQHRSIIALRLAQENPNWNGQMFTDSLTGAQFPVGYGPGQQDVVMASMIAAYGGVDPNKVVINAFPKIPLPNWNFQYTGLSKIEALKPIFRTVTIRHTYRCTYNVAGFNRNLNYEDNGGYASAYDMANNFIPLLNIGAVQISEQFSPLIGFDVVMQNSLTANVQYRKTRNLGMSFANNQLTDNKSDEIVIGLGYRIKNVKFNVRSMGGRGKKQDITSDLNFKLDFSIRKNLTVLRRLNEAVNQISAGQTVYSINFTADYMVSKNLTIALYHDQIINKPSLSTSIPNTLINSGISLRLTLAQ